MPRVHWGDKLSEIHLYTDDGYGTGSQESFSPDLTSTYLYTYLVWSRSLSVSVVTCRRVNDFTNDDDVCVLKCLLKYTYEYMLLLVFCEVIIFVCYQLR